MFKYILKRLGISLLILLGVSLLLYTLLRCMPTDFIMNKIVTLSHAGGDSVTEELKRQM